MQNMNVKIMHRNRHHHSMLCRKKELFCQVEVKICGMQNHLVVRDSVNGDVLHL